MADKKVVKIKPLEQYLIDKNMTQQDLAIEMNVTRQYINKLVNSGNYFVSDNALIESKPDIVVVKSQAYKFIYFLG